MAKRNCIYTGLTADEKDSLIPRDIIKDQHNWTSGVPCCAEYKAYKRIRKPNELEIQAVETFYLLELARTKVELYESILADIQVKINSTVKLKPVVKNTGKTAAIKKEKQIAIAEKEFDLQKLETVLDTKVASMLEESKGLWDE